MEFRLKVNEPPNSANTKKFIYMKHDYWSLFSSRLLAAYVGNRLRRVGTPHRFHIQESCYPETSANVCQHMLHNNPKERRQPAVSTRLWSAANESKQAVLRLYCCCAIWTSSWDSVVSTRILPARQAEGPNFDSRQSKEFILLPFVQTGCAVRPGSYSIGKKGGGDYFPRNKAAGAWNLPLIFI